MLKRTVQNKINRRQHAIVKSHMIDPTQGTQPLKEIDKNMTATNQIDLFKEGSKKQFLR